MEEEGSDKQRNKTKLVVPRQLREELSEYADKKWIKELAQEKTGRTYDRKYSRILAAILPVEVTEDDIMSQEMVTIEPVDDNLAQKVNTMAGDNVTAQDVIAKHLSLALITGQSNEKNETEDKD